MSDSITSAGTVAVHDTAETVKAATFAGMRPGAVAAAVAQRNAAAAPAGELEQWIASVEARFTTVERTVAKIAPMVETIANAAAPAVAAVDPALAPMIARLPQIEAALAAMLAAINAHFGTAKIPGMPVAIAPAAAPAAPAS